MEELTPVEREVYEFISQLGEVMAKQVPTRLAGAIPGLVEKGLLEVYKRRVSPTRMKKMKFVRVRERENP